MTEIEKRILKKINDMTDNISYNTSKGSFARDIISSVAIEMVKEEDDYKGQLDIRLLDTATGEDLDIAGADKAIKRREAIKSTGEVKITGANGSIIKRGYIVINSSTGTEYEVLEEKVIENIFTTVKIQCIKAGIVGNCEVGQINKFAQEYTGLSKVENLENITNGKDRESDEEFRTRALEYIRKPRISWNKYVLEDKAKEVEGVEQAFCVPRANGNGTAKIIITQKNSDIVSTELKEKVKNHIDLEIISDVNLTIEGVEINSLNIIITGIVSSDFNIEAAKTRLQEVLNKFFFDNLFKKKIYYFDVIEVIQHSGCIIKIGDVTLNGTKNDIVISENKLCKCGLITINNLT